MINRRRDGIIVRVAEPADLGRLVDLCIEHSLFERSPLRTGRLHSRLEASMFGPSRRLWCLLATCDEEPVGYATYSLEYATWSGSEFVHMDTLFVRDGWRGRGIGEMLFDTVVDASRAGGVLTVEWQTPDWNIDGQRFYERRGVTGIAKVRYRYDLSVQDASVAEPVTDSVPLTAERARAVLAELSTAWVAGDVDRIVRAFRSDGAYGASIESEPANPAVGHDRIRALVAAMLDHDAGSSAQIERAHIAGSIATVRWVYSTPQPDGSVRDARGVDVFEVAPDGVVSKDAYRKVTS